MIYSFKHCQKDIGEVGQVFEVAESYVRASGMPGAFWGEGVSFESGEHGRVVALNPDEVEILVLSRDPIKNGTRVARTGSVLTVSVGEGVLGHTIDAFGHTKDERRYKSDFPEERPIDIHADGRISRRRQISRFMATGVSLIDVLIPIGRGQRELVIGDKKTGKTHFLLQTVLTQARMGKVCVYGAIGKRKEEIKAVEEFMQKMGIEQNCVIVAADSFDSPGEIFLAPYTALTVAEYFRDKGGDVLLVLDDLTTHAKYYRELSLVGRKFPGRESYPGDIFHVHSRLMERAGCYVHKSGEATITCLPVAESAGGDMTGYIQTNLMSMTDGHIFFDIDYFLKGIKPAVNIFLSVTRVGRQTQGPLMRDIGFKVMGLMKKYENLQKFLSFGPELGEEARNVLKLGEGLGKFFNQISFYTVLPNVQMFLIAFLWAGLWNGEETQKIQTIYDQNLEFREMIDAMTSVAQTLGQLIANVRMKSTVLINIIEKYKGK